MNKPSMTPAEFDAALRKIYPDYDTEAIHRESDDLMENLLISLGYGVGIEFLRKQMRWYA